MPMHGAVRRIDLLAGNTTPAPSQGGRPFIGVTFVCSAQYVRVYRDARGERYLARCPSCGKTVTFRVGPGGTDQRFFEVSCA